MRSIVWIDGVLRGMGREAPCAMVAFKDTHPGNRKPTYTRWTVLDAPPHLPDGRYTVFCGGLAIPVRHETGLWLADESPISGAA